MVKNVYMVEAIRKAIRKSELTVKRALELLKEIAIINLELSLEKQGVRHVFGETSWEIKNIIQRTFSEDTLNWGILESCLKSFVIETKHREELEKQLEEFILAVEKK